MKVVLTDLGSCGALVAEYDARADAIAIDARACERVAAGLGASAAALFVLYATAHELFHRAHPQARESQAHAFARSVTGAEAATFERALRR